MASIRDRSRVRGYLEGVLGLLATNFTAVMLVVPGIILYIYILYIIISKLVYPASFLPFTEPHSPVEDQDEGYMGLYHPLVQNALLVLIFGIQHSIMACRSLKGFFEDIHIPVINYFWQPLPALILWRLESHTLILCFLSIHMLSWISVACSVFTIDYLELLGIKQIYYSFYGFDNPILYKSDEQQQLLHHNRHPIFLAPILILWAVPVMTYDRLLVAVMFPLYMGLGTVVDRMDVQYILEQFATKKSQLLKNGATR